MGRSYFEKTDCDNKNVVKKTVDDKLTLDDVDVLYQ